MNRDDVFDFAERHDLECEATGPVENEVLLVYRDGELHAGYPIEMYCDGHGLYFNDDVAGRDYDILGVLCWAFGLHKPGSNLPARPRPFLFPKATKGDLPFMRSGSSVNVPCSQPSFITQRELAEYKRPIEAFDSLSRKQQHSTDQPAVGGSHDSVG